MAATLKSQFFFKLWPLLRKHICTCEMTSSRAAVTAFWGVTSWSLVYGYRSLEGIYCLYLQGGGMPFYSEDKGRRFLKNVGNNLLEHMASQRSLYMYSPLLRIKIYFKHRYYEALHCKKKLIFNSHGHTVNPLHSTGRVDRLGVHALKLPKPKSSAPC